MKPLFLSLTILLASTASFPDQTKTLDAEKMKEIESLVGRYKHALDGKRGRAQHIARLIYGEAEELFPEGREFRGTFQVRESHLFVMDLYDDSVFSSGVLFEVDDMKTSRSVLNTYHTLDASERFTARIRVAAHWNGGPAWELAGDLLVHCVILEIGSRNRRDRDERDGIEEEEIPDDSGKDRVAEEKKKSPPAERKKKPASEPEDEQI